MISTFTRVTYSQVPGDEPEVLKMVYKTIGWTKLKLYIYQPAERNDLEQLSAVVFFHGGGWGGGHAWQFIPQCKYLAEHGMEKACLPQPPGRNKPLITEKSR